MPLNIKWESSVTWAGSICSHMVDQSCTPSVDCNQSEGTTDKTEISLWWKFQPKPAHEKELVNFPLDHFIQWAFQHHDTEVRPVCLWTRAFNWRKLTVALELTDGLLACCHTLFVRPIILPANGLIPTVCCQDVMVPVRDRVAIILPALSLSLFLLSDLKPVSQTVLISAVCATACVQHLPRWVNPHPQREEHKVIGLPLYVGCPDSAWWFSHISGWM